MRTKKALINSSANIITFIIAFIPNLIIRKVFLETLGNDLLGLTSLYTNIIGWLSIVEMGVGTAIIFSLYKPFAEDDKKRIRAYIRFYGQFYRIVGFIMLIGGVLITPFISFFINGQIDIKLATIGFVLFLINSFISYLFSHRLCILNVAQEGYKIAIATTITKLVISVLQLIMLETNPSFISYISIQIVINLIYFVSINVYVGKKYRWLDKGEGDLDKKERKVLLKNVKAMFMHRIGSLVVFSTDSIVISKYVGLVELAKYTNYQMIITALQNVISTALNGITASIGNMLTDDNHEKAYDIHNKVFFLNFWISSFVVITLYNTLEQFVGLWVGNNNLLSTTTFIIILINLYFTLMRGTVEKFQEGSGTFYYDRHAPFCEAAINLVASLILVKSIGIAGVFLGTLISNFAVVFWTKPYVVYKYVFKKSPLDYFKMYFKYAFIAIIPLVVTHYITMPFKDIYNIRSFITNCLINILTINAIYLLLFFKSKNFSYYVNIIQSVIDKTKAD